MTLAELRRNWVKQSNLVLIHKTLPRTKIELVPAEVRRNEKHFIVMVKGKWIPERSYIKPFPTLDAAWRAAEQAIAN